MGWAAQHSVACINESDSTTQVWKDFRAGWTKETTWPSVARRSSIFEHQLKVQYKVVRTYSLGLNELSS